MFSEVYDCIVEFQYTYMKFKKKFFMCNLHIYIELFLDYLYVVIYRIFIFDLFLCSGI